MAAELLRTLRKIHQVECRLADIETEAATLRRSEAHELLQRAHVANTEGRDLLAEMGEHLTLRIATVRAELMSHVSGGSAP